MYALLYPCWVFFGKSAAICTCIIGFHLLWTSSAHHFTTLQEVIYMLVVFGIPLVIELILLCLNWETVQSGQQDCWFDTVASNVAYAMLKIICYGINIVFLSLVLHKVRKSGEKWGKRMKSKEQTLVFIQVCYLVYTISGFIALDPNPTPTLRLVSATMGSSQGLLDSLVVSHKPLRECITRYRAKRAMSVQQCTTNKTDIQSTTQNCNSSECITVMAE